MKKRVVIDTNIIFKSLRSQFSKYRDIMDKAELELFCPNYLISEIFKHKERLLKASKVGEEEVYELLEKNIATNKFCQ